MENLTSAPVSRSQSRPQSNRRSRSSLLRQQMRNPHDPLQILERLLNTTTLQTQRVQHGSIIDIGYDIEGGIAAKREDEKQEAVREAIQAAEERATRELRAALKRLRKDLTEEKLKALEEQKAYYEELARKVAEARDRAEEERIRELTKKLQKEKEEALRKQWEEAERIKQKAIDEACALLEKRLRDEFALEKELAIAETLQKARERHKKKLEEAIAATKEECERLAQQEAARVAKLHQEEIKRHEHKYDILTRKYKKEIRHKEKVEGDFKELQTDYQRFMDYTDGYYHSDYMMRLRKHGENLAKKRVSVVTYEDIEKLDLS
ncbi:uncharacterized protein LOC106161241 [Lingula anatina]|uniref:Uncharacterized protein LOC106161241 n=1 Tax=Lingula anatina TaxID=7574 RepID=A0A1S3I892_LINAN|nr:uncharacterized protein LOC106161241 [Lingula anatina]|eukprot:XP_013393594.1 uncharacterized protein LOC106161241 [Lingula anatina]